MATIRKQLLADQNPASQGISGLRDWGKGLTAAVADLGWVQCEDTGQVVWEAVEVTITGTQLTGNIATYTFSGTPLIRVGQSIAVTGLTNDSAVFNITGVIVGLTDTTVSLAKTNADIAYSDDAGLGTVAMTATSIPSNYTFPYYVIFRMDDELQATAPCYLKLMFGSCYLPTGGPGPSLQIWVGTGSNGSGTLLNGYQLMIGSTSSSTVLVHVRNMGTTTCDCIFTGDPSRLSVLMFRDSLTPIFFNIERSHDDAGADTGDYLQGVCSTGYSNSSYGFTHKSTCFTILPTGAIFNDTVVPSIACAATSTVKEGIQSIFPLFSCFGGVQNPMLGCISGKANEFTELDIAPISLYSGRSTNYIVTTLTNGPQTAQQFGGAGTNNAILMRYDS